MVEVRQRFEAIRTLLHATARELASIPLDTQQVEAFEHYQILQKRIGQAINSVAVLLWALEDERTRRERPKVHQG